MVAFTRNDLWALGCTLYQMLSGSSPFKDASEWLIFQRIITRDLKFPEFFSHEARDLIDKLLDTDPSKRPGAGPDGYASVKKHPFFNGVDWKNLRKAPAPRLVLDHDVHALTYKIFLKSCSPVDKICIYVTVRKEFLEPGEVIVMISKLKKLQKLTNRKVQLILTDKPKLLCMDPSKMTAKANIIWSHSPSELSIQVANSSHFKICTHKKVISFEDAKQQAWQWKKAIEGLQHH
ncbi:hypothetical protein BHE74_00042350 [Ensete ventricosum]|uniref:Uncharacterized protein n=1 Tax=Ensete ventricosum TaxID=4639 RepID=A0A444G4Y7_ENSVE|nr:hypothetical protein B296_00048600 [Ensete ventricosum]RWW29944.1 hypothetical protein GW17_00005503 [Ensete ventricosum]RWW51313.1 hypothetical protein BHE74_00042350 [Ensete ventricosum]RZS19189.1 hypothetical protein BHM03_00051545 [Ensete ventricosum]